MDSIFLNEQGERVMTDHFSVPSMCPEFDPHGCSNEGCTFWKVNLKTKRVSPMKEKKVRAFYKTLKLRQERVDFWLYMKAAGFVNGRN